MKTGEFMEVNITWLMEGTVKVERDSDAVIVSGTRCDLHLSTTEAALLGAALTEAAKDGGN